MVKKQGFQFKQFFIEHSASAMKVGTDSILLGSWADAKSARTILDIGTGSGLLAIMLAQKSPVDCQITGIDIDSAAIQQAMKNSEQSPWSEQLFFNCVSIQNLCSYKKFDLIIANPPYFPINKSSNLNNMENKRINARQTTKLSHQVLLENVYKHLATNGRFCCVLPDESVADFILFSESIGLHCAHQLRVKAQPTGKVIRHLLCFVKMETHNHLSDINIYSEKNEYSAEYRELCKEYYLNF